MKTTASYSPKAARALGFLKRHQNDIDIYVEDSGNPNMWVKFLQRLLSEECKLESVSVLGGRKNVLEACKANQEETRPSLYIIDADFDLLLGLTKPRLKNLYRLRAYSIENYLLQALALSEIATTFSTRVSKAEANRRVDLEQWIKENTPCLEKLFLSYAVSQLMDGSKETVGYSVHRLLVDGSHRKKLCQSKVRIRVREIFSELETDHGRECLRENVKMIRKRQRKLSILKYVSCKDYVMPQIYYIMKHEFGMNIPLEAFKNLLAVNSEASTDPYLRRRLRQLAAK